MNKNMERAGVPLQNSEVSGSDANHQYWGQGSFAVSQQSTAPSEGSASEVAPHVRNNAQQANKRKQKAPKSYSRHLQIPEHSSTEQAPTLPGSNIPLQMMQPQQPIVSVPQYGSRQLPNFVPPSPNLVSPYAHLQLPNVAQQHEISQGNVSMAPHPSVAPIDLSNSSSSVVPPLLANPFPFTVPPPNLIYGSNPMYQVTQNILYNPYNYVLAMDPNAHYMGPRGFPSMLNNIPAHSNNAYPNSSPPQDNQGHTTLPPGNQ